MEGKKSPGFCTKSKECTVCLSSWEEDKKTNILCIYDGRYLVYE